jgi:CRP-like cAMP-binding protein
MDFKNLATKKIAKSAILLSPGQSSNVGYKVISGCLKSYVIDNSGKEHILQFAPEGWFISDLENFTKQTPSQIFIDAVEDAEVELFTRDSYSELKEFDKEGLIEFTIKLRNNLFATNNRLISLLSWTAEERYLEFMETYPDLIQRLPQKLIASYLGMTPEHLSYIRGKLSKKKVKGVS